MKQLFFFVSDLKQKFCRFEMKNLLSGVTQRITFIVKEKQQFFSVLLHCW
jgi:hypothetical protein